MIEELHKPIVMIGGGGHASVLADILLSQGRDIIAVISNKELSCRSPLKGITLHNHDEDILNFESDKVILINGIGMLPKSCHREKINEHFLSLGYQFGTVIAGTAFVSPYSKIETGAQILPMSVIQTGVTIGKHSIINTGVLIEHDCKIGAYNHIAPKATLCGNVTTRRGAYIGANATIVQSLEVGESAIVGAGATVTQSLAPHNICYPSRSIVKPYC